MSIWSTNYPTELDTTGTMSSVQYMDIVDPTHLNELRNAVFQLQSLMGSDNLESGSMRFKTKPDNIPYLQWYSLSTVNIVNNNPYLYNELSFFMNDGNKYVNQTSSLPVTLTTTGFGGLDSGSEASDTWYYIYAVPSGSNNSFNCIASVRNPLTGPVGYSTYRYLGAIRNSNSSHIHWFKQFDRNKFDYFTRKIAITETNVAPFTNKTGDLSGYIPYTANSAKMHLKMDTNYGQNLFQLWVGPSGSIVPISNADFIHAQSRTDGTSSPMLATDTVAADVPIDAPQKIIYQLYRALGASNCNGYEINVLGWSDKYL